MNLNINNLLVRIETLAATVRRLEQQVAELQQERTKPTSKGKRWSTPSTATPQRLADARVWAEGIASAYSGRVVAVTAQEVVQHLAAGVNVTRDKVQLAALALRLLRVPERRYAGRREFVFDGRELHLDA